MVKYRFDKPMSCQENNDHEVAKYLSHDCQIDLNLFLPLLVPKRKKKQKTTKCHCTSTVRLLKVTV